MLANLAKFLHLFFHHWRTNFTKVTRLISPPQFDTITFNLSPLYIFHLPLVNISLPRQRSHSSSISPLLLEHVFRNNIFIFSDVLQTPLLLRTKIFVKCYFNIIQEAAARLINFNIKQIRIFYKEEERRKDIERNRRT